MGRFAASTSVSVEKTRAEIELTLNRYGATAFAYGSMPGKAMIEFLASNRRVRFILPLPDRADKRFWYTPSKNLRRNEQEAYREWEQACRQNWRALLLCIKAKLEAVDCKISTFESEFMANIVLPGNQTVGDWMQPQIERAYESGEVPQLFLTST